MAINGNLFKRRSLIGSSYIDGDFASATYNEAEYNETNSSFRTYRYVLRNGDCIPNLITRLREVVVELIALIDRHARHYRARVVTPSIPLSSTLLSRRSRNGVSIRIGRVSIER